MLRGEISIARRLKKKTNSTFMSFYY